MANPWDPRGGPPPAPGEQHMSESTWKTVSVPGIPAGAAGPANVAAAMFDRPMRVLADNVGPVPIRVAGTASALGNTVAQGTDHYVLLPGAHRVFVLAPKQKLFAVAVGNGGQLSVHTSDALPFDLSVQAV